MTMQQASLNVAVGTPCEFILLNPPRRRDFAAFQEGVDFATVDGRQGSAQLQLGALEELLQRTKPTGATPLAERLKEIHHRIQYVHGDVVNQGLRVIVVVATDGLPSSAGTNQPTDAARREVVTCLRELTTELPVFCVIRLTTDDDDVVAYYNTVDEEEELPLEVIDDIESEAKEALEKGNGWLTYSPIIHMIREGGTLVRLLDALDERNFEAVEVKVLAGQVLQLQAHEEPLPSQAVDFCQAVRAQLQGVPMVYDPLQRRMAPCISVRKLRTALGVSRLSACMCCFSSFGRGSEARAPLISH